MIAFATRHFALNARDKDGTTYRETLEGLIKRTRDPGRLAEREAELECPPFPLALDYLWRVFQRLSRRRTSSGFGSNPITWADISAFEHHAKFPLQPWEVEVIEDLDDLDRAEQARAQNANSGSKT